MNLTRRSNASGGYSALLADYEMISAETEQRLTPRIYAANLSDYNNGILHGPLDRRDPTTSRETQQVIDEMLAAPPSTARCGEPAKECGIHGHEGFDDIRVDENHNLATIAKRAEGIERHGEAFAACVAHVGAQSDDLIEQSKTAT